MIDQPGPGDGPIIIEPRDFHTAGGSRSRPRPLRRRLTFFFS